MFGADKLDHVVQVTEHRFGSCIFVDQEASNAINSYYSSSVGTGTNLFVSDISVVFCDPKRAAVGKNEGFFCKFHCF